MEHAKAQLEKSIAEFLLATEGSSGLRDGLTDTPKRFVKQILECMSGYEEDPAIHLKLFENKDFHDLVTVSSISFGSLCEHHLLPFYGYIDIGYLPKDKILGISKFARIVDTFSKRLQVQERLTQELADFLTKNLESDLIMIRAQAYHTCMIVRGVSRPESITETFVIVGDTKGKQTYIDQFQKLAERRQSC